VAGLVLAAVLLAWSGVFNVAASRGHWAIVEWFLAFGMRNSVELRGLAVQSPPLDNPNLITLGAAHFHGGCAFCHGTPGTPVSPIAQHMLPPPPDLKASMRPWTDGEMFWIVKHGLKYTGMPGWAAIEREDEIWAVVAFLKQLRSMDAARYRDLALGSVHLPSQTGEQLATIDSSEQAAGACARCHGAENGGPASTLVPVLHGQPAAFLAAALQQYAEGSRRSGIMQPIAAALDARDLQRLAEYYAGLAPPGREQAAAGGADLERGRQLATAGDAANGVPACDACHSGNAVATYPRLAGQSAAYMAGQLALWRAGHHTTTGAGAIMAPIAQRLSASDVDAVTAYFASLPVQTGKAGSP
jgi:cytochrome c553